MGYFWKKLRRKIKKGFYLINFTKGFTKSNYLAIFILFFYGLALTPLNLLPKVV
jgi:hypothetical protein